MGVRSEYPIKIIHRVVMGKLFSRFCVNILQVINRNVKRVFHHNPVNIFGYSYSTFGIRAQDGEIYLGILILHLVSELKMVKCETTGKYPSQKMWWWRNSSDVWRYTSVVVVRLGSFFYGVESPPHFNFTVLWYYPF